MSVRQEDLGSLKVLYITSNRIYNSYRARLHNNTEYTVMYQSCTRQSPVEDRCLVFVLEALFGRPEHRGKLKRAAAAGEGGERRSRNSSAPFQYKGQRRREKHVELRCKLHKKPLKVCETQQCFLRWPVRKKKTHTRPNAK